MPFWRNYPLSCPSRFLTPEMLHIFHKKFWDHDCKWCINALGTAEIDFRFSVLQPVIGLRHFKEGISSLKQVTGRTHRDVQRFIVGVIAGSTTRDVVIAIRALMDFRYRAQAYRITDKDAELIRSALQEFHSHKDSILASELRRGTGNKPIDNWYIPKSMPTSTKSRILRGAATTTITIPRSAVSSTGWKNVGTSSSPCP